MHEAGYRALGLAFAYVPFELRSARELPVALAAMRTLGIRGFGVSMPYKLAVLPLLDALSPVARAIGAANTIVQSGGVLTGHNTDAEGAVRALSEAISPVGARVLVLGAGGAARAVVHGLVQAGALVTIANRSAERAQALALDTASSTMSLDGDRVDLSERLASFDAVVNASSRGMSSVDPTPPIDARRLRPSAVVMDAVYAPVVTRFVEDARARGLRAVSGERMLLHQAAAQFELYTGREAPLSAMENALASGLRR